MTNDPHTHGLSNSVLHDEIVAARAPWLHHIKAGAKPPAHKVGKGIKPATPVKRPAHTPVVVAPVVKAPVSTCTATSTHACP